MTLEVLLAFIVYAFVSAVTPGPNNTMLMASGLHYGVKKTTPHALGVALGFGFMVFAAGMGLLSLLDYIPYSYEVLHVLSIAYLLYLAFKIATTSHLDKDKGSNKKPMTFLQAAAFQWINPKAIMMAIVAITTYVPETPEPSLFINVVTVSFAYTAVCIPCSFIWAGFGSSLRRFLSDPMHFRIFNITMALLLVASLYPMLT
ncbi:MAG: LysE family translocator [Gammaproteobacteria bacterium]